MRYFSAFALLCMLSLNASAHHYKYYYPGAKTIVAPGASFADIRARAYYNSGIVVQPYSYGLRSRNIYTGRYNAPSYRTKNYLPIVTPGTSFLYYPIVNRRSLYLNANPLLPARRSLVPVTTQVLPVSTPIVTGSNSSGIVPASTVSPRSYNTRPAFRRTSKEKRHIPGIPNYKFNRPVTIYRGPSLNQR